MAPGETKEFYACAAKARPPLPPASKNGVNLSESNSFPTTDATRQTEIDPLPSYFQTESLLKIP